MDMIIQDTCSTCGQGVVTPERKYNHIFCSMTCKDLFMERNDEPGCELELDMEDPDDE